MQYDAENASAKTEIWLSLELGADPPTVALHRVEGACVETIAQATLEGASKASETVLDQVALVLEQAGLQLSAVDRTITSSGPGSFTGLRVSYSVLKAFSLALGRPMETVDAHEALALEGFRTNPERSEALVATRLTRDKCLVSRFAKQGNHVRCLSQEIQKDCGQADTKPINALLLAQALPFAKSRQTFASANDVASASPVYFGSRDWALPKP